MLLAINIGNTNTTAGFFENDRLLGTVTAATSDMKTGTDLQQLIDALSNDATVKDLIRHFPRQKESAGACITGCVISSVVPKQTGRWTRFTKNFLDADTVVVNGAMSLGIRIHYEDPSAMGADRICAGLAAFRKYGGPLIIVDFGTATTYTVLDISGNILGGVIAPGIVTAAQELFRRTAQLPSISYELPKHIIGTSTRECMESGIFYAGLDAAEGMLKRLQNLSGPGTRIIATGGLGPIIAAHIRLIHTNEPHLVLIGARLVYEKVTGR